MIQKRRILSLGLYVAISAALVLGAIILARMVSESHRELQFRFLKQVLLERENGDDRGNGYVIRWTVPPKMDGSVLRKEDVANLIHAMDQINAAFEETDFYLLAADPDEANIHFLYKPVADFAKIAKEYDFEYVPGSYGYFTVWLDDEGNPDLALIMIADELEGFVRRAYILHELFNVLGPMNDSDLIHQSALYDDGVEVAWRTTLGAFDRKILRFLYTHLKPGDDEAALRAAFDKYWD